MESKIDRIARKRSGKHQVCVFVSSEDLPRCIEIAKELNFCCRNANERDDNWCLILVYVGKLEMEVSYSYLLGRKLFRCLGV